MNERIKLLALQAEFSKVDLQIQGDNFQRFAELIVRDCINKIETYRIPVGNSAAGEMACKWTYDALKEIRDEIKEHFEVEEVLLK